MKGNIPKVKENLSQAKEHFKTKRTINNLEKQSGLALDKIKHFSIKNIKTLDKTIKTFNRMIKTSNQNTFNANKAIKQSNKTLGEKAKVAIENSKKATKALVFYVKKIMTALRSLVMKLIAGGWLSTIVIIVIMSISESVFVIFFSSEDSGTRIAMKDVVKEINEEYETEQNEEKESFEYDVLELSGSRVVWKDVIAVYSVKVEGKY